MITIDSLNQNIVAAKKLKKTNKKDSDKKTSFANNIETDKSSSSHKAEEVAHVAPMLFLQEIDEYSNDLKNLDEFAEKAFKCLKDLQLSLMQDTLSARHLHNLKDSLNSAQDKFVIPELEQLANEIKVRIEVEIAKIEVNSELN